MHRTAKTKGSTQDRRTWKVKGVRIPGPVNVTPPLIAGVPEPGQTLTATGFVFTGDAPLTYAYRWYNRGNLIAGETGASYVAQASDDTDWIEVAVRATDANGRGSAWIFSDQVIISYATPAFSVQPTFDAASYVQGATVTITIGTAGPAATIDITTFALDGVDKRGELVQVNATTWTWDTTGEAPGAITFRTTATNTAGSVDSNLLTRALEETPVTVPGQFGTGDWSVANEGTGGKATVTVTALPSNGGSAITALQYQVGAGAWTTSGITAPGTFVIAGLTNGVLVNIGLRAVNSAGNGTGSATKSVTPSDITPPDLNSATYDTPTNALTVAPSELSIVYYLVNGSATPLTCATIRSQVLAGSPSAYGTMSTGQTEVTPNFAALTAGTYYLHLATEDPSGNVEAGNGTVIEFDWPGASDTTAPVLSSPTDTANGASAATGSVSTDEGNGTLYWVVSTSATAPSAVQVEAGQMHTGSAAAASGSQGVSGTGVQNIAPAGLTASTAYTVHYMHKDAAGNRSTVASADGFTTGAAAALPSVVNAATVVTTSSTSGPFTGSYTPTDTANDAIFIVHGYLGAGGAAPTFSFTCGGATITELVAPTGSGSNRPWVAAYRARGLSAGSNAISCTIGATQNAFAMTAVEVDGQVNAAATDTEATTSAPADLLFTKTPGGANRLLLVGGNIDRGNIVGEIAAQAGSTLEHSDQTGTTTSSDTTFAVVSREMASPSAVTVGFTYTTADQRAGVYLELEAA